MCSRHLKGDRWAGDVAEGASWQRLPYLVEVRMDHLVTGASADRVGFVCDIRLLP